jgi:hypothetical protein
MINSLLMLGSTYKNKKINIFFITAWVIFMLQGANLKTGLVFPAMNLIAFGLVVGLGKLFQGKYSNKVIAVSSVLIWSVIIDIMCYYLYPQFTMGQNILTYIANGILFNYKYVGYNVLVVLGVYCAKDLSSLRRSMKTRKVAVHS